MADIHKYLIDSHKILHCGAHSCQERSLYRSLSLQVLWIEGDPTIFEWGVKHLESYQGEQKILNALITDKDNDDINFNVTSNRGLSSSIFELNEHRQMHPGVRHVQTKKLKSITLNTLLKQNNIDYKDFDCAIFDLQGAELLALKGFTLDSLKYIIVEAANFDAYKGCATDKDISKYLEIYGFFEVERQLQTEMGEKKYWDIIYKIKE